jgi:hypothetical protein
MRACDDFMKNPFLIYVTIGTMQQAITSKIPIAVPSYLTQEYRFLL